MADVEASPSGQKRLARMVAQQLVAYRQRHGLSQRDLAALLEWSPSVVARLELAQHDPRMSTLDHLAARLGLEVDIVIREPRRRGPLPGSRKRPI
jgi:transcriptional regulator with XRE-family HTH domain